MSAAVDSEVLMAKAAVWEHPVSVIADGAEVHTSAPFGRLTGRAEFESSVVDPIRDAFDHAAWEPYVFLGGQWGGAVWVAATGDIVGEMSRPLALPTGHRIPSVDGAARLRYGIFYRVEDGRAVEVRALFDLLALAAAAGIRLLPPFAGRPEVPRPALGNGLSVEAQDPAESAETLQLVEDMLGGCNRLVDGELRSMGMDAYWHDDMRWYGPWGVGSTHGFQEFQDHAQGPSVASFPNRRGGFHQARIADGVTAAFTGWPSLQGTFDGVAFRGIAPTGGPIGQNLMDFYVRRGDRLHENWVLIDLIDFAAQCGVDLLEGLDHG